MRLLYRSVKSLNSTKFCPGTETHAAESYDNANEVEIEGESTSHIMPVDAAAADGGEHFTANPFGRRGSGGVPVTTDFRNRPVVKRRYVVHPSRIFAGVVTSSCPVDRHRIKLRQVNLTYSCNFFFHFDLINFRRRTKNQFMDNVFNQAPGFSISTATTVQFLLYFLTVYRFIIPS